jgi:hypothetical protein
MFPEEIYNQYLQEVGVQTDTELTYEQMRIVFLKAVRDFIEEKLSLDELSAIGNQFCGYLLSNTYSGNDGTLLNVVDACGEMSFDVRNKSRLSRFIEDISDVYDFYEKYKGILDK